jgi:DNA repair protein RadC
MKSTDTNLNEQKSRSHSYLKWHHPGGKLRELGADKLTDAELLSILISIGVKGRSAEEIAEDILLKFGSFKGMANQPLQKFLEIKGLGDVKIIRIAAAFEIARRIVNQVLEEHEKEE